MPEPISPLAPEGASPRTPEAFEPLQLEARLLEFLPGIEILDRELEIAEGSRADLVGVDEEGRLTFVLLARGDGQAAVLASLDALAFARQSAPLLVEHLGCRRLRPERAARIVVVAEHIAASLADRLVPLRSQRVELLELRTLRSATAERTYLIPALSPPEAPRREVGPGADLFTSSIPEELRDLARLLVVRMARVDDELEAEATRSSVIWNFEDEPLAQVAVIEGRLRARVAPAGEQRVLRDSADVEFFVEETLARYVDRLDLGAASALDEADLVPGREGPMGEAQLAILTPDELEAFHQ